MKRYQKANDAKAAHFSNFMTGQDLQTLVAQDEARYVKAIEERETALRKRDERKQ